MMGIADKEVMDQKIKEGENKVKKEKREKAKQKLKKERVSFFSDFKAFITKGNVLDLGVAMVMATSFNAIVSGLVKYIITPFVSSFTKKVSIEEWEYVLVPETLDEAGEVVSAAVTIQYGLWLQTIVDFLIIAFSIFVVVRLIKSTERKLRAKELAEKAIEDAKKKEEADAAAAAAKQAADEKAAVEAEFYANVREQAALLREIRDNMKK
jgi:large conductance mechanosensitive channel